MLCVSCEDLKCQLAALQVEIAELLFLLNQVVIVTEDVSIERGVDVAMMVLVNMLPDMKTALVNKD